jgi:hypothetical protein
MLYEFWIDNDFDSGKLNWIEFLCVHITFSMMRTVSLLVTLLHSRLRLSFWISKSQMSKSKLCYDRRSVGQSVFLSSTHLGLTTRFLLLSDSCGFVDVGRSLWREKWSAVYNCCWSSPAQSFLGPSPAGLVIIFYYFKFETPPNLEGQVPVFISPRNRVAQLYPQALGSLFLDIWGYPISSLLLGGLDRRHRLQGFHYCVSYLRFVGHACNTALTSVHSCAKRFAQSLSSDGHNCFIPLPRKLILRIESTVPYIRHSATVYRLLVGKPKGMIQLGRPRPRWVNNIKWIFDRVELDALDWFRSG